MTIEGEIFGLNLPIFHMEICLGTASFVLRSVGSFLLYLLLFFPFFSGFFFQVLCCFSTDFFFFLTLCFVFMRNVSSVCFG